MSFREEIAKVFEQGYIEDRPVYERPIVPRPLDDDDRAFLSAWMESSDPALHADTEADYYTTVAGAIRQRRIAKIKYGKKAIDTQNEQANTRIKELNRLAGEAEKMPTNSAGSQPLTAA
jgi:hypothetical protein